MPIFSAQFKGLIYGVLVTVVVAVATDLAGIQDFKDVGVTGLGLTAVRSAASFVIATLTAERASGG